MTSFVNFPALVGPALTERKNLCADDIMTFGHYDAAIIQKKSKGPFSFPFATS